MQLFCWTGRPEAMKRLDKGSWPLVRVRAVCPAPLGVMSSCCEVDVTMFFIWSHRTMFDLISLSVVPQQHDAVMSLSHSTVTSWSYHNTMLWCHWVTTSWRHNIMTSWCYDYTMLWCHWVTAPWRHEVIIIINNHGVVFEFLSWVKLSVDWSLWSIFGCSQRSSRDWEIH